MIDHIAACFLLAPHLTDESADELIAAASHRSKAEIELLLAQRAPRPDVPQLLQALPAPASSVEQLAPGPVATAPAAPAAPPATKVVPLAPQRFALQVTIGQTTHDKLLRAQALLRHRVPSGDFDQVLEHALDALLRDLERQKFAATARPRAGRAAAAAGDSRRVPNHVKRAVHARDGEQCAFVSEQGERCTERGFLELDHVVAYARGGPPTVPNTRLLCAAHDQYEADRAFGAAFMQERRAQAEIEADVILGLRGLGWSAADARLAVAKGAHLPVATLEGRMRAALAVLHSKYTSRCSDGPAGPCWQISVSRSPSTVEPRGGDRASTQRRGPSSAPARRSRSSGRLALGWSAGYVAAASFVIAAP